MADQKQDDKLELTYSSSVPILDVALNTCRRQWTIGRGGERESGVSVLMARLDDDIPKGGGLSPLVNSFL